VNDADTLALLHQLNDRATRQAVLAERALLRGLGGGCQVPIGAATVVAAGRDVGRLERARELGADEVVALDGIAAAFGEEGFTVCIDPLWGEPLAGALASAARRARIVHVGQSAGPEAPLRSADVRSKELTIQGHSNFALSKEEGARAYLELLGHLLAGSIVIDVETYDLDHVEEAWARQQEGGGKKIVVTL